MISCDQAGEPRRLSPCMRSANRRDRLGVVAGVLIASASRAMRADGRLELVADVGHEVAADLLDPAGLGAVLDQQQARGARAQRRRPGRRRPAGPGPAGRGPARARVSRMTAVATDGARHARPARGRPASLPRTRPQACAEGLALTHGVVAVERRSHGTADGQHVERRRAPAAARDAATAAPLRPLGDDGTASAGDRRPADGAADTGEAARHRRVHAPAYARNGRVRTGCERCADAAVRLMFTCGLGLVHAPLRGCRRQLAWPARRPCDRPPDT